MKKRYTKFIIPLYVFIDLIIINTVILYISDKEYLQPSFLIYINLFWIISSFFNGFYKVFRHTNFFRVLSLLAIQFSFFFLGFFTYFSLFREGNVVNNQTVILITIFLGIAIVKYSFIYALKKHRAKGNNFRKVIVLGSDETAKKITSLFKEKKELGYEVSGVFSDKITSNQKLYKGSIEKSYLFLLEENIDEVYCSLSELHKEEVKKITTFANENNIVIKLIPNANELYSKRYKTEYYEDSLLVLNVNKLPFESIESKIIKRVFDVVFSLFILFFLMMWLTPIIWILIKLESKGPAFFKQKREGLNGKLFVCYKFRSMKVNIDANYRHTIKNDVRITKFGAFLRKTSLDELPQIFNVLQGNMSVVGPRPHLKSLSVEYQKNVNNYLERHTMKPGITGLAQVRGYRGEIKKKSDIKNRIRLDVFYIENWSILLDVKIIVQTIFNVYKGEEKAY
ncbi:UDP-glucose:undecaprenyl-phosphate glucose-1-phosphate transferase [Polaribacter huanghezhanensis]|uniref:exopolysaccharide biosynthesis polyprenyl glycosylphosphotransferase n=1 Tax=Polaribacter huanghezhanensis TaxID=1354726 RepID=UPI0026474715|nr:exopolysaccharide biosynthesis polyprenyl glycosylphosphotransferase [Polaribacter huanghezhanensis]WKD85557.1 UDP-glucose:undecaprenyl-phosphate glucose-1-phosphate transferase [Polaribacter huanghezhanensis]